MKQFLELLAYLQPYKKNVLLNVVFNVLYVLFSLCSLTMIIPVLSILFDTQKRVVTLLPLALSGEVLSHNFSYYITQLIDNQGKSTTLMVVSLVLVCSFLFKNLCRYLALYSIAPARNGIMRDLRRALYGKILSLHLTYFNSQRKGDMLTRMSADVQEVEWSILSSIEALFRDPFNVLVYLVVLFAMSAKLSIFVLLLLPVSGLVIGKIGQSLRRNSRKGQQQLGDLLSLTEETITGLRVIKGFNAEQYSTQKFGVSNGILNALNIKIFNRKDLASPTSEFLGAVVMAVIIWFGGQMVFNQEMTAAVFITYLVIFSQLMVPAKSVSSVVNNVQKGLASMERINQILDAHVPIVDLQNAVALEVFEESIEFKNVYFAYGNGDNFALKDINLKIPKGKIVALVGASGSGKSTFADLIPRFIEPTAGEILIDGRAIKSLTVNSLRSLMGLVSQQTILFNDTIFNNIAFGLKDIDEAQVLAAAKVANAHEFIIRMEQGYQTNIGDGGSMLSGGQRQRISIARAVLKNPDILILDEATSALDTESERLVQEALNHLMHQRTTVVIAHRLSTVQAADEIVVLEGGKIVERGTHEGLIEQRGVYKRLIDLQQL